MKESSFEEKKTKIIEFILFLMFLYHYFPLNHRKSSFQVIKTPKTKERSHHIIII